MRVVSLLVQLESVRRARLPFAGRSASSTAARVNCTKKHKFRFLCSSDYTFQANSSLYDFSFRFPTSALRVTLLLGNANHRRGEVLAIELPERLSDPSFGKRLVIPTVFKTSDLARRRIEGDGNEGFDDLGGMDEGEGVTLPLLVCSRMTELAREEGKE